jgi:glycosyltransferase involved in cell wall biosynthesis
VITVAGGQILLLHITAVPQALASWRGQVGYMKQRGLHVHYLSSPGRLLERFSWEAKIPAWAVPLSPNLSSPADLRSLWRLWRRLRELRPTIVHAHSTKGGLLGLLAARLARVPVLLYHLHGLPYVTARGPKRWLLRGAERLACRLAHRVLCVSHSVRAVALFDRVCPADKMCVLLNGSVGGVDAALRFHPGRFSSLDRRDARRQWGMPPDALVMGFVGPLVRDKGVVELVAAWQQLRDDNPHLHLVMAGEFGPRDPLPLEVRKLLAEDERLTLLGVVPHEQMPEVYQALDLLVLPTHREGMPSVLLEASAMGLPVVATGIPGCVDVVEHGVTGTLVPPGHVAALTEAVQTYLGQPLLRQAHGLAGRDKVLREFAPQPLWEATWQEYRSLLDLAHPDEQTSALPKAS